MIGAASERLHQYILDVLFVIYSPNRNNDEDEDECYQVNLINEKKNSFFISFSFR